MNIYLLECQNFLSQSKALFGCYRVRSQTMQIHRKIKGSVDLKTQRITYTYLHTCRIVVKSDLDNLIGRPHTIKNV